MPSWMSSSISGPAPKRNAPSSTNWNSKALPLAALEQAVGRDYDPFDLILHVAYDQPPLTRKERAERVRKRNYFARYGGKARAVMEALLDKYADAGPRKPSNRPTS